MNRAALNRRKKRFLAELAAPPLAELAPRLPFWKNMLFGEPGHPSDSLYIVASGQVVLSRRDDAGDEHPVYLLGPGDLFGEGALLPDGEWLMSARALTDGEAHAVRASQLSRFAQYYPQLAAHVILLLAARLERANSRMDLVTNQSARARVLGLLRTLGDYHGERAGGEVWLPLRLTQSQLGDMVGLARETVARALTELETDGVIRRRGRRGILLRSEGSTVGGPPSAGTSVSPITGDSRRGSGPL